MLRAPPSKLGLLFPNSEGGVRLHSNMLNREYWPLQLAAGLSKPTGKVDGEGEVIIRALYISIRCATLPHRHGSSSASTLSA